MKISPNIAALLLIFPIYSFSQQQSSPADNSAVNYENLRNVVQTAVLNNPEVQAKFHAYKAATEEIDVARGGFLPRADVSLGAGRESLKQPPNDSTVDYNRRSYLVTLSQMIFDGFATSKEVKRLGKAEQARYYELLDASEGTALEAARAYFDVIRYRFLVTLAEDNYVQHKATHEQLVRRTQSGVGRRADMEQAGSRLALAESNLTIEIANLHDVTARYQRIIGDPPSKTAVAPVQLGRQLPANVGGALERALRKNPALLAAIENLEASQFDLEARRAAYMPRIDVRARTDNASNYLGVQGDRRQNVLELVLNYNLFNGGSDRARERQYLERKHLASDLRDKACRDIRQTLAIAFNDTLRLKEQVALTQTQVNLLERTRDAYRDQFNVGQRSLLDLLDTENELLNARRTALNMDVDLSIAYIRAYAGMGELLDFLGLKRLDGDSKAGADQLANVDTQHVCPSEAPPVQEFDRESLNARALAILDGFGKAAAPQGMKPAVATAGAQAAVAKQVTNWASAWASKDVDAYLQFYGPSFTPDGGLSRKSWEQLRQSRINKAKAINVEIENLRIRVEGLERAVAEFRQNYSSDGYQDSSDKILEFVKQGEQWLIQRETSLARPLTESGR